MNPLNAGLPQAPLKADYPVGMAALFPQMGGVITLSDDSVWLQSGTAVTYDSSYWKAARVPHVSIYGTQKALPAVKASHHSEYATNGSGIIVISNDTAASVIVSTDGGATFSTVVIGGGFTAFVTGVAWTGDRFVIAGNTATELHAAYSTNGTAWTVPAAVAGLSATASTVRLGANLSTGAVLAALQASSGSCMFKCLALATFTAVAGGLLGGVQGVHGANSSFLVLGTSDCHRLDGSAAGVIASYGGPFIGTISRARIVNVGSVWIVNKELTAGQYSYTSDITLDAAGWQTKTLPYVTVANVPIANSLAVSMDGTYVYIGMQNSVYRSSNGLDWSRLQLSVVASGTVPNWMIINAGSGIVALNTSSTASTPYLHFLSWLEPQLVGSVLVVASGDLVLYYRVK